MMAPLTAATKLFLLLGDPVEHSLSPVFQNAAIRHHAVDAVYAALPCKSSALEPLMRTLARAGGGGNVTVPHKAAAARCLDVASADVLRTGACNTFWGVDGRLHGDNTDVAGMRVALASLDVPLAGSSVLVLGAGGAAAAAVAALLGEGCDDIVVLNRTAARAAALVERCDQAGGRIRVVADDAVDGSTVTLVINATSASLTGADLPFDLTRLPSVAAALDLNYAPGQETPFVRHARALGVTAQDGTTMLIAQGAAAFARWFDVEPPVEVMRRAIVP